MPRKATGTYLFASLAATMLVACLGDPYSSSYTMSKPNEADLIGTWVPDKETFRDMHDVGGYATEDARTRLTLRPDGTFEMVSMPDWWRDPFGRSHGRLLGPDYGTWRLKEHSPRGRWELGLDFPRWGSTAVSLRRNKPPYVVHFTLGDPDSGQAMSFVRQRASE